MKENNLKNAPNAAVSEDNPTTPGGTEVNKKKKDHLNFDSQIAVIRAGLANAGKPGLFKDSIEKYGYTEERITEGLGLLNATETARAAQLNARAAKAQKYREADQLRININKGYLDLVAIGRVEFQDNTHILYVLGLNGPRKATKDAWREQVMQLYGNTAEPGVIEGFAKHNITIEELDAKKLEMTTWDNLTADVKKAKSDAEKTTEDKNKAYKILMAWWHDFSKVVSVAVRDNPQLKEQISKVTPTTI